MNKVRHVLGISGGKDSAALAIYLKNKYPNFNIEYYCCDTEKELDETYELINNLEAYFGKEIIRLKAVKDSPEPQFDHFLKLYGGYLPSSNARWCTKNLKLTPFEKFVGDDPVISYVGIRDDEDRDGYISKKPNIQSIFPFRKNIWSEDVISRVLNNDNVDNLFNVYLEFLLNENIDRYKEIIFQPISPGYNQKKKLNDLLTLGISRFNHVVFKLLKGTEYPLALLDSFPLLDNEDSIIREDVFNLLENSGIGVPKYYKSIEYEVNGEKGEYSRSRSGCFFCFFQQKIEWVWLYENRKERFLEAMKYEKDGFTWNQDESLADLIKSERIKKIKEDHLKRSRQSKGKRSPLLIDILDGYDGESCTSCFI